MSHIIAPEVTINETPLLLDLCSESFRLEAHDLTLPELEYAAKAIKEACAVTSRSINNAKANILMAFMADPKCRRWLKKEFQKRVDCDNKLLTTIAREVGFKFYTAEAIILEEIESCGEDAPIEEIAQRAGATEKAVERVKNKLRKKREDELLEEQIALEVAMASEKDDAPPAVANDLETSSIKYVEAELVEPEEIEDVGGGEGTISDVERQISVSAEPTKVVEAPRNAATPMAAPSMEHVKVITSKVKKKIEADYLKEIEILKNMLKEKDAEIERLKGMLERQAE